MAYIIINKNKSIESSWWYIAECYADVCTFVGAIITPILITEMLSTILTKNTNSSQTTTLE
jgi:hypothetical protein